MTVSTQLNLQSLIERYERHRDHYRSPAYNETQLRVEFVDDLFIALGWDVRNEAGYAEAYKDVVHEDAIKVGTATKAPDYAFRIGGVRKFFLEAKRPSIDITSDPEPAWQLRRYAWSAKLPLSILTNFEHLAVYDTRVRPSQSDSPSTARVKLIHYTELAERWQEIEEIFSIEAIRLGEFDKYAESTRTKRGTAQVDDAFLADLEHWRDQLARNIALRNVVTDADDQVIPNDSPSVIPSDSPPVIPSDTPPVIPSGVEGSRPHRLSQRELNFAVQITIDRIIFLRICEDRGIEQYGRLQALTNGTNVYARLQELYRQADERYNSGLFHFHVERDRSGEPDRLTPSLQIDDRVLKDIFKNLYYPHSPYEFSALPADILGQIYERFLGSVIRLTPTGRAVVEEKPEVRKAGGVYYTPTYIVDYIVEQTVGKLLKGKTPRGAARLKILDPACGSGSFLIGAYQYLLDWHRDWYLADGADKHTKVMYQGSGGEWRLTTAERRRILLNNIYGVDIDAQAVEVTKLSLLLKVLEGETEESLNQQLRFVYRERALPDLRDNIKCGNSLIGPDFYQTVQLGLSGFNEEERYRINVFDWEKEFPAIMSIGGGGGPRRGFDVVIGNPPYGFHQIHEAYAKEYFRKKFKTIKGSFENYFLFYEATLRLLKRSGLHGFIVPVTWLTIPSAHELRKYILENFALREIVWLPELVFRNAQVNTLISILENGRSGTTRAMISDSTNPYSSTGTVHIFDQQSFIDFDFTIHIFDEPHETELLAKIKRDSSPLGNIATPRSGYNPYEVGTGLTPTGQPHSKETIQTRPYHSSKKLGPEWTPELIGRHLGRYQLNWPGDRFVKYGAWLSAPRDPNNFVGPRLLVQEITGGASRRVVATFTNQLFHHSRDIIPVKCTRDWPSPLFLLGVVNSRLITWWHHHRSPKSRKQLFPKVLVRDVRDFPVPELQRDDPADVERHDRMVSLVQQMLDLNEQLDTARTDQDKRHLQRLIDHTDREIDTLVYELYDLTDEEIAIVEEEVG